MIFKTNFHKDLELGQQYEDRVIELLCKEFPTLKRNTTPQKGYDLIDNNGYKIEVKTDLGSIRTSNIVIEYMCNGKPSGLSTTTAQEWVIIFFYDRRLHYGRVRTEDLKTYIKNNNKHLQRKRGGDKGQSFLILINKEDFIDTFFTIAF